jgi:hypothetical protein
MVHEHHWIRMVSRNVVPCCWNTRAAGSYLEERGVVGIVSGSILQSFHFRSCCDSIEDGGLRRRPSSKATVAFGFRLRRKWYGMDWDELRWSCLRENGVEFDQCTMSWDKPTARTLWFGRSSAPLSLVMRLPCIGTRNHGYLFIGMADEDEGRASRLETQLCHAACIIVKIRCGAGITGKGYEIANWTGCKFFWLQDDPHSLSSGMDLYRTRIKYWGVNN